MKTANTANTLYEVLTDYTNYEWDEVTKGTIYEWVEGTISLNVLAALDKDSMEKRISFMHKSNNVKITADYYDGDAIKLAANYAQFLDTMHYDVRGNQAQFDAYLLAHKTLGGNYDFTGSAEIITAIVGEAGVFCDWDGRRYELYDHGLIRYAITADGLRRAYSEIVQWTEVVHRNLAEQNA